MKEKKFDYETLRRIAGGKKGKAYVEELEEYYVENYGGKPINVLLFSDYERCWKSGNLTVYHSAYFELRNRLFLLQAIALRKSKYLEDLENVKLATRLSEIVLHFNPLR